LQNLIGLDTSDSPQQGLTVDPTGNAGWKAMEKDRSVDIPGLVNVYSLLLKPWPSRLIADFRIKPEVIFQPTNQQTVVITLCLFNIANWEITILKNGKSS